MKRLRRHNVSLKATLWKVHNSRVFKYKKLILILEVDAASLDLLNQDDFKPKPERLSGTLDGPSRVNLRRIRLPGL